MFNGMLDWGSGVTANTAVTAAVTVISPSNKTVND